MEFVLLHRPISYLPLENMKASAELAKKARELFPGIKPIARYVARSESLVVCIVDVPNVENLVSFCEQMNLLGVNTEIIPVEKMEVAIPKMEKALAEAAKRMKK
jgi:hypothetical protein